jgi:LysR family transcriptional regulator, hypochlorite-specific transcription factor HypT
MFGRLPANVERCRSRRRRRLLSFLYRIGADECGYAVSFLYLNRLASKAEKPMEFIWLEDFLALVDCGNFSRAAELRHVTQPAFSRRIRALERWVGVDLFERDSHPVTLTEAGHRFRLVAEELLRLLLHGREEVRQAGHNAAAKLKFAVTHALLLKFFPAWLHTWEATTELGAIHLLADNLQACEAFMLRGEAECLLYHHHPAVPGRLGPNQFWSVQVGDDRLVPVVAPNQAGQPRYVLPGAPDATLPHLVYGLESGLGRILRTTRGDQSKQVWLEPVFTSHLSAALKAMAQDGRGIAWLPLSLVRDDLDNGSLVRAGDESWDTLLEIRLLRPHSLQRPAAEKFWSLVVNHAG